MERLKIGMKVHIPKQNSKYPKDYERFLKELEPRWEYLTAYGIDYKSNLFGVRGPNGEYIGLDSFAESDLIPYEEQEYRILNDDEILQEGEEYYDSSTGKWYRTVQEGDLVKNCVGDLIKEYRRKINNETIKEEIKMKQLTDNIIVKNVTKEQREFVFMLADKAGINVYPSVRKYEDIDKYPHLGHTEHITAYHRNCNMVGHTILTLGEFCEAIINYKAPKKPLELTGIVPDYTVIISEDNIKVGCQEISYENFDKLVKAIEDLKKDLK